MLLSSTTNVLSLLEDVCALLLVVCQNRRALREGWLGDIDVTGKWERQARGGDVTPRLSEAAFWNRKKHAIYLL